MYLLEDINNIYKWSTPTVYEVCAFFFKLASEASESPRTLFLNNVWIICSVQMKSLVELSSSFANSVSLQGTKASKD